MNKKAVQHLKGEGYVKLRFEWQYKVKSGQTLTFSSEYIAVQEALIFYEDIMKTGRVQKIELFDTYDSEWSLKELKKYVKEIESEPQYVVVHFDAGFDREARIATQALKGIHISSKRKK